MLLILVEVSVEVARRSRKILILVEVFVKVADCSTELLILVEVSVNVVCRFTQSQTAAIEPSPCNLLWWKYL